MVKETPANFFPFVLLVTAFLAIYALNFNRVDPGRDAVDTTRFEFPAENYKAPDFTLTDLSGKKLSLSDFRGRVIFLNFWATWCVTCEEEMPSMEKLYQRFKDKGLVMLTISIDKGGEEAVRSYLKKFGLTFTVMIDARKEVANLYQTTGVPETFIINKDGVIVHKAVGPRDWSVSEVMKIFEVMLNS